MLRSNSEGLDEPLIEQYRACPASASNKILVAPVTVLKRKAHTGGLVSTSHHHIA